MSKTDYRCVVARGAGYWLWIDGAKDKPLFNITKENEAPPHCAYNLAAILVLKGLEVVSGALVKNAGDKLPRRELDLIAIPTPQSKGD